MQRPARDVRVSFSGDRRALAVATVRRVVSHVLEQEDAADASITVTFLSSARMRGLNRRTFGKNRSTDVIAFGMPHDGTLVGDVYVCPAFARRSARTLGVSEREELVRLVIHGTLHVLGRDHPAGEERVRSAMWRDQERYVERVMANA